MTDRPRELLDALLDRQARAWRAAERVPVESLLAGSPFRDDPEAQLDLIYNEVLLREELGENPPADEYLTRYPHLRADLELHFEVHRAVTDPLVADTPRLEDTAPLADAPVPARAPGPDLPEYELVQLLGRGGMGVVYEARHRRLRRRVALKTFEPGRVPLPREVQRFRAEAEAIARLQHPNIVQIFEVGEWHGRPFLALELAEGGTLGHRLQLLPFAPRAAAGLVETLARAVHHAHTQHVIHRDLKPANVLFAADGTPKLTDFGLAKLLQADADLHDATRSGEPVGTPRYMAPEQAAGRHDRVGPATDVYALGTLLYECLTGQVPFVAAGVVETLERIRHEEPVSPRRLQPSVPRDLATICLNCLHKEPERRYPSAQALADDLRRFRRAEPITARPTPPWERAWKWCQRRPTHAALIAVAVLFVLTGVAAAAVYDQAERERVAQVRENVERLMEEGQDAMIRNDAHVAGARFHEAWLLVKGEPALSVYRTGVAGWLDHSRKAASTGWKQRLPPPTFDERRDEALVQSALLDPHRRDPVGAAREAVAAALEFAPPDDAAWRRERGDLILLDADLVLLQHGPEKALARLDEAAAFPSRLFHDRRAALLDQLRRPEEAAGERGRAARLPPDETTTRFFGGVDRLRRRDFAGAAREFAVVLDADKNHFAARLFAAVCALRQGRPAEAHVGLTACVGQRERFAWNFLLRGQCAGELGDLAAAEQEVRKGLDTEPPAPARFALLTELGSLHFRRQQWEAARAAFEQAAAVLPDEPVASVRLADAEARLGRWDRANALLTKVETRWPGEAVSYRERAVFHRGHQKWAEALADLDRVLAALPASSLDRAADQVERARVLVCLGRLPDALDAARDAARGRPEEPAAWLVQADVLGRQGRYTEAVAAFDRGADLGGASFELFRDRGAAHLNGGDAPAAIDDLSRALALRPDAGVLRQRGRAYQLAGAPRLAERDFEQAAKLQSGPAAH